MEAELKLDGIAKLIGNQEKDPPMVKHAQHSKYWNEWLSAIHEELEALKAKEVYKEIDKLPPGKKAVESKWVLHIKCDKDGQILRFKDQLVAKGFTQIFGQDYTFNFTPVTHWESIQSILCIVAINDFEL